MPNNQGVLHVAGCLLFDFFFLFDEVGCSCTGRFVLQGFLQKRGDTTAMSRACVIYRAVEPRRQDEY